MVDNAGAGTDAGNAAIAATGAAASAAAIATVAEASAGAAAAPAAVVVPESYDFKAPAGVTLDAKFTDAMTARAKALGLSKDAAQTFWTDQVKDSTDRDAAAARERAAQAEAEKPGGRVWQARVDGWTTALKADPDFAKTPDEYTKNVELAQQAVTRLVAAKIADPKLVDLIHDTGLGSHPLVAKLFAALGRQMAEPTSIVRGRELGESKKKGADSLYARSTNKPQTV